MPLNLSNKKYDLSTYPDIEKGHDVLIFPNLQSNTLLLIYLLVKYDVITITQAQYEWLRDLCLSRAETHTKEHIQTFNQMIDEIAVNSVKELNFLQGLFNGDLQNDYFMFKVLSHIQASRTVLQAGCQYDILLTKDIFFFLQEIQSVKDKTQASILLPLIEQPKHSLKSMQSYVDRGLITREELLSLVKSALTDHLKLFSIVSNNSIENDVTSISTYPHNVETLRHIYRELTGHQFSKKLSPSTIETYITRINQKLSELLGKNALLPMLSKTLTACINTQAYSNLLAYLLNTTAKIKQPLTTYLDKKTEYHAVYSQKNSTPSKDLLTLTQASETKGQIKIGSMPNRSLSYALVLDKDKKHKKLSLEYILHRGRFTLKNSSKYEFQVPLSMGDEEVMRRFQLIFSDGKPDDFFPEIIDPIQRKLIETDLNNIRYGIIRDPKLREIEPYRGVEDFFNHAPSATIAPLNPTPDVKGQSMFQNKKTLDIQLVYNMPGLLVKTNYRYYLARPLTQKDVDNRIKYAFKCSSYPFQELYTLLSTPYKPAPRKPQAFQREVTFFQPSHDDSWDFSDSDEEIESLPVEPSQPSQPTKDTRQRKRVVCVSV